MAFAAKISGMLSWPAALTLRERLDVLRADSLPSQQVKDLAERRFKRWQAEKVFAENKSLLDQRLAAIQEYHGSPPGHTCSGR